MYCIRCGVALADTEKSCPLCHTTVYHPDIPQPQVAPLYPNDQSPALRPHPFGMLMIITLLLFMLPISICLVCDWQVNGVVNWSGYVVGALLLLYVIAVLPNWFRHPNPVIFVPVSFCAAGLFLLYINLATGGSWFLSFAFPVTGGFGLLVTAVVTLLKYLPKGKLYILAGAFWALGGLMLLMEFLLHITFDLPGIGTWSFYPLIVFALLGCGLMLIAIVPAFRESLERKFFL